MLMFVSTSLLNDMKKPAFEDVPNLILELHNKVDTLSSLLENPRENVDRLMPLDELRSYLPENPARQTIYGWVNDRKIPFEKHGKYLYFRKSSIDSWLNNGRR